VAADFKRRTAQGCEELRERLRWGVKGRVQDFWRWAFKAKRARKRERVRSKRKRGLTILENFKTNEFKYKFEFKHTKAMH
jgi:hypothetical protein